MDFTVKVCGVRDDRGARSCVDADVDLVGFNFVPSSKRYLSLEHARALVAVVGSERSVGVFRDQAVPDVLRTARETGVRWIQLHGEETPDQCATIRENGFKIIKACAVTQWLTREAITPYVEVTDLMLFDAETPGSGRAFGHERLIALDPPRPFLIAGGLDVDTVLAAVDLLHPDGVDTASGVERNGRVAPELVRAFCRSARNARDVQNKRKP